jgi:hypothetical protein
MEAAYLVKYATVETFEITEVENRNLCPTKCELDWECLV